jgi:hypothetical protein
MTKQDYERMASLKELITEYSTQINKLETELSVREKIDAKVKDATNSILLKKEAELATLEELKRSAATDQEILDLNDRIETKKKEIAGLNKSSADIAADFAKQQEGTMTAIKEMVERSSKNMGTAVKENIAEGLKAPTAMEEIVLPAVIDWSKMVSNYDASAILQIQRDVENSILELSADTEEKKIDLWEKTQIEGIEKDQFRIAEQMAAEGASVDEIAAMWQQLEDKKSLISQKAAKDRQKTELDGIKKNVQQGADFIKQGLSIINQSKQAEFQAAIDRIETERDSKLDAIDAEIAAAGDNEEKKKELLKKREAIEDEYNEKIRAQKRAAWEADKESKILDAIINTAVAVTKALPNILLAAIVGAMGAAQIALIASQPTPKFKYGTQPGGFIVPPGFENDTFPILVSSGEKVDVTPASSTSTTTGTTVILNFNSPIPHGEWIKKSVEEGLRKTGLTVDRYFVNNRNRLELGRV